MPHLVPVGSKLPAPVGAPSTCRATKVYVRPWDSIGSAVRRVGRTFETHGDILELAGVPGLRAFCFRNPEHIEQIFKDPQVGGTKNPKLLDRLKWAMPRSGVVLKGGAEWKERRRQVQAAFKSQKLSQYAEQVPAVVTSMLQHWQQFESQSNGFDFSHEMHNLITQLAFQMYFSKRLDGQELDRIAHESHYIEFNFVRRMPLWIPTHGNRCFKRYVYNLRRTLQQLLDERRAASSPPSDMLSIMANLHDETEGRPWPDHEIVAETFNVYIATCLLGTSLCWAMYQLAQNPAVQEQLRAEARQVLGDREPTLADLERMPYSEMVLMEVLRLYPSSWGLPRYCEAGMEVGGVKIPPDSMVISMVYFVHHHAGLWPDPERFDPERFAPQQRSKIVPGSYFPYGRGERTCLGVNLAPLILRQILAMICRDYRVTFKPQHKLDPVMDIAFELHPRDKMVMAIERA